MLMRYIESTYRGAKHELLFEIVSETPTEYVCKFVDRGESIQNADKLHTIRKVLINAIYRYFETEPPKYEQISIFDLIGE